MFCQAPGLSTIASLKITLSKSVDLCTVYSCIQIRIYWTVKSSFWDKILVLSSKEIHFILFSLIDLNNASFLHTLLCCLAKVLQLHLQTGSRKSANTNHCFPLCRCCRRSMVAGRTSVWSTTLTTLPTCASRGLATGSSTGSPSTTRGYV